MTSMRLTELHLYQKKSLIYGAKGFGKIKVDDINCMVFIHQACHHFLEGQQIGETRPTGQEIMLMI